MGNSNEVVAEYVSEEKEQEMFRELFKEKIHRIYYRRLIDYRELEEYYKNIIRYRGLNSNSHYYYLCYLNIFMKYDTYDLAKEDFWYVCKAYKSAMINYLYKWYSNSKSNM